MASVPCVLNVEPESAVQSMRTSTVFVGVTVSRSVMITYHVHCL
jgi:hypothetical protein